MGFSYRACGTYHVQQPRFFVTLVRSAVVRVHLAAYQCQYEGKATKARGIFARWGLRVVGLLAAYPVAGRGLAIVIAL